MPPITHFMCILTLASHLAYATFLELVESSQEKMPVSFGETSILAVFFNVKAPAGKGSIYRKQRFKKQLLTVNCLPATLTTQAEKKKLVTPCGLIARNMLAVCECLYCDL